MIDKKVYRLKKKTKPSSQKWLRRHLNDPYVHRAAAEGFRCRSAFKLKEIQDRFSVLSQGQTVLDLGCAPGGWSQVVTQFLKGRGRLIGIDLLAIEPLSGMDFYQGDILELPIEEILQGVNCDVVLSDMAPSLTGHGATDRIRMEELVETVWAIAQERLKPGGALIFKTFHGDMLAQLVPFFGSVQYVKPLSSRSESKEMYLVARNFKGRGG